MKIKRKTNKQLKKDIRFYKFVIFFNGSMACFFMLCGMVGIHYDITKLWLSGFLLTIIYLLMTIFNGTGLDNSKLFLEMRHLDEKERNSKKIIDQF